ncbi:hypothetical protein THRCLA_20748, partial [Thraustotheca clavata]
LDGVDRWNAENIQKICDTDGSEDVHDMAIRANASKILSYLRTKVERLLEVHQSMSKPQTEQTAFSADFQLPPSATQSTPSSETPTKSTSKESKEEDRLQFALLTLGEYLDTSYINQLVESYGLPVSTWANDKKVANKQPSTDIASKYDNRSSTKRPAPQPASSKAPTKKKLPPPTGMKSISSFFSPKQPTSKK